MINGKHLIKEEKQAQCLNILKKNHNLETGQVEYLPYKEVCIHYDDYKDISMKFIFKDRLGVERDTVIFANKERVFELNFET